MKKANLFFLSFILLCALGCDRKSTNNHLVIGENGYFEMPGLSVLVYNNTFPEGHQGGVEIIQHDNRVATNGNLRLSPSPGQWQPVPQFGEGFQKVGCSPQNIGLFSRTIDTINNEITMPCSYPDSTRHRTGFNPIIYPDLQIRYNVRVKAQGKSFTIAVDMEDPVPEDWIGRVGYNIELFPGNLYGKSFFMDNTTGTFPRQANGPTYMNVNEEAEAMPLAEGNKLVIAPESDEYRMTIESADVPIQLLDGSLKHNNGWFVVRSLIPEGATKNAIQWKITPHVIENYTYEPVIHLTQVGYHPKQDKIAHIELDKTDQNNKTASLQKLQANGEYQNIKEEIPDLWGRWLRYNYVNFDFSEIRDPGIYRITYGDVTSNNFQISDSIYKRHVWQPTLEYFLPVQMCHMRVNQKYRVWHGACHLDDALMAPLNVAHFDGYNNENESSTLSKFAPLDHVPGLNVGAWHDAADYDIRIESQTRTVIALALAYEEFHIEYDQTYVDQKNRHVEIHQPDGKADILQQVEHGVLSILAGYHQFGRLYRGIIVPTLRQYVHLGDGSTQTDNQVFNDQELKEKAATMDELWFKRVANRYSTIFDPGLHLEDIELVAPTLDDRLVFNETAAERQLLGAVSLAIASRVLTEYDPELSKECLQTAEALWQDNKNESGNRNDVQKIHLLAELILATNKDSYKNELCKLQNEASINFDRIGWSLGRILPMISCEEFVKKVNQAAINYKPKLDSLMATSPFGSPLEDTEIIGFRQYYLHQAWPELYSPDHLFAIVNYNLGCRPGSTTNTLVSGVGVNSPVVAYGFNRADWSYIPGGTFWNAVNLVSPDFPEDKVWPYLWQEREYIINSPCYYMFSVLAADKLLDEFDE